MFVKITFKNGVQKIIYAYNVSISTGEFAMLVINTAKESYYFSMKGIYSVEVGDFID